LTREEEEAGSGVIYLDDSEDEVICVG